MSDIWAVGCLVYELAALRSVPFVLFCRGKYVQARQLFIHKYTYLARPPFDAPNQLTLALKINKGTFARIPMRSVGVAAGWRLGQVVCTTGCAHNSANAWLAVYFLSLVSLL